MSLIFIEAQGWRPVGAHIRVDLRHLPEDTTVALVGQNGAGKSTLLKLLGWAEHGDALTGRGWAGEMRHPASAEATIVVWRSLPDGRLLKIRRRVSKRDTHAFIDIFPAGSYLVEQSGWMEAPGTPETLCSGLVSTAADALKGLGIIPTALYMAAGAADQAGEGSFFALSKVDDRRAVIGAACDTERLGPLAKIGETHRPGLKRVVEHLSSRVEALSSKVSTLATVDAAIALAEEASAAAQQAEAREVSALAVADTRMREVADNRSRADATLTGAASRAAAVSQAHAAARSEWEAAQRLEDVEPLPEMRERLAKARAIRDRQVQAKAAYEESQRTIATLTADVDGKVRDRSRYGQPRSRAVIQSAVDIESPVSSQLPTLLQEVETARAAAAAALEAHTEFENAPAALARAEAAAKETSERRERLIRQGAFVGQVPCRGEKLVSVDPRGRTAYETVVDCSACPALTDAREARDAVPGAKAKASKAAAELSEAIRRKRLHDESAELVKASAAALTQAQTRLAQAQAAKSRLDALLVETERLEYAERADAAVEQARAALAAATAEGAAIVEAGRKLRAELAEALRVEPAQATPDVIAELERQIEARATAAVDGGAAHVATLEARIVELRRQEVAAHADVDAARAGLAAAQALHAKATEDVDAARQAQARAAAETMTARVEVARLKGAREPLARDVAALPVLEAALADARLELDDYVLMETGFGPRGVPGLIIDAEGGRLAEDMQACLDVVYGERAWDVEFKTFDPNAAATKQELADLFVRGPGESTWRNATDVSGGEGKMLDQAFRGALRRMVSRRTGRAFAEVIHDERDTGLDIAKQREYVAMIRATGSARHLIVSHNAQVQAACDHRLCLDRDGGVWWT